MPDWLDTLEKTMTTNQKKLDDLGDQEAKLRQEAIERVHRTELPRLLRRIAPLFSTRVMSPQDVKTIFHPLDYIAFPGMNAGEVKSITFLDHKSSNTVRRSVQDSISNAVSSRAVSWGTIRIDTSGKISGE
jgi:predicted Holliday junction resolvase-like endonuclease